MARRTATRALDQPSGPVSLTLPHLWSPRSYQIPLAEAMPANGTPEKTRKRIVQVWHRRAGKDLSGLALTAREMAQRIGYYMHVFPTLKQGKAIIWDGKDNEGIPFMDRFPEQLILEKNETECQLVLKPLPGQPGYGKNGSKGSIWQLRGADDPDSLRGGNCVGVVFSEFQQMDPATWEIVRPILEANGGWAMFLFTPEGQNHAYDLYNKAKENPDTWFCQLLTINDTKKDAAGEDGTPIVVEAQIEQMRKEGTQEEMIQQEYYCSFAGYLRGTIFGDLMTKARNEKRVTRVPYNSNYPVGTWWDIGRSDACCIWFFQKIGPTIYLIDYMEAGQDGKKTNQGADYWAKQVRETPYIVTRNVLPHDAKAKGFSATSSTEEIIQSTLGGTHLVEKPSSIQQTIDMTRRAFTRFVFDEVKCRRGIECLEKYKRKYNEQLNAYVGDPIHDEYSNGADAFRTGVYGDLDAPLEFRDWAAKGNPSMAETQFDVFESASVN